jgi:uncharacterized membrane protein YebE (DUF533 family)
MKKFLTDNIHIIVVIAVALAGYAVYTQWKKNQDETKTTPVTTGSAS